MDDQSKVDLLQKLIQIDTANGNEQVEAEYLKQVLAAHHIKATLVPFADSRANLVAEIGNNPGPVLALAGHMDTVAVGDRKKWQYGPFSAKEVDGQIYGRGSVDMQSGLAAMVCALIELKEAGLPKRGKVRLLATVDEEVGGMGSMELTKKGYAHDIDALVIGEATTGQVEYAHCGSFDYSIESFGKVAHSSRPELGDNAVTHLAQFIGLEAHAFDDAQPSPILGAPIHTVTVFHGGDQLNSIPDYAYLKGNVRTVPECGNAETERRLQAIVDKLNQRPGYDLKMSIVANFQPVVTNPDDDFVSLVQEAAATATGQKPAAIVSHGATDASRYVLDDHHFAFVEFGPGEEKQSHQINEHVGVDDYLAASQTYVEVAKHFLSKN